MFHDQLRRPITKQIFFLLFLLAAVIGMTRSVSADSGPLFNDGVITGRITDSAGDGVAEISVTLQRGPNGGGYAYQSAFTDADGFYTINGITRGSYRVRLHSYKDLYAIKYVGGGLQPTSGTAFDIWDGQPVEVNETVELAGFIEGLVDTNLTVGISYPSVFAYYFDEGRGEWVGVGSDHYLGDEMGRYRIGGLPGGRYIVSASDYIEGDFYAAWYGNVLAQEDATPVVVTSGTTTTGIDISLGGNGENKPSIQGRVVSAESGLPLENIVVNIYRNHHGATGWSWASGSQKTDANGSYTFKQLAPGNYKLEFEDRDDNYAIEFNGNKPTLGGAPELVVTDDNTVVVDAELAVGARVSLGVKASPGVNFRSFTLYAYRWNDHDAWLEAGSAYQGRGDSYVVTGLPDGKYVFMINGIHGNNEFFNLFYGDTSKIEDATQVQIEAGTVYYLDPILLEAEKATLRGRVTDRIGQPVPYADVWIHELSPDGSRLVTADLERADANGYFENSQMTPGRYKVEADSREGEVLRTWYGDVLDSAESPWIDLAADGVVSADIHMRAGGSIQGHVSVDSTFAHNYVSARAYRLVDGSWVSGSYESVANDGSYKLRKLIPGMYKIYLSAGQYAPYPERPFEFGEWVDDAASRDDAITFIVEEGHGQVAPDQHLGNIIASRSRTDGAISGQILSAAWQSGEGFEARAYLKTFPPRGPSYWVLHKSVTVDEDGNYQLAGLKHGFYVIGFYDTLNEHKPEYYNNVADIESATELEISAEQPSISGINAILQLSATRVK